MRFRQRISIIVFFILPIAAIHGCGDEPVAKTQVTVNNLKPQKTPACCKSNIPSRFGIAEVGNMKAVK